MTTTFILCFLLLTSVTLYFSQRLITWSAVLFVYLALNYLIYLDQISPIIFHFVSAIFLFIVIFFNLPFLRRFFSKIVFNKVKGYLPSISETEQLALNAGDSWYEKDIFCGNPDFKKLHEIKKFELTKEERNFLENETRQLCAMIDDWHITAVEKDLPVEVWDFIREKGFFGLVINKKFGGKGFSAAAHSEIVMLIATRSVSAAVTVMVPNSLGPGELLFHYGTEKQKNYYLPRLAKGEEIPCFALTGPTAGSDATSIPDEGIVCEEEFDGKKVLGIRLKNINKRYITLAPIATLVGLAFKLKDPNKLLKNVGKPGITCVLLPHDHPGLEIGNRLLPLDQVFMNGTVRIESSFIPMDWVIGGQKCAGEGWKMLVECLSIGRGISLPACGTANALLSTLTTSAYALIREQFNAAIGNFEGVEDVLAKMGGMTYMVNATRQFTVTAVDVGVRPSVASAIAKYHITECGRTILNEAMDIHAGRAIIMGPNNYLARAYQAIPIGITVEGANIMTRNLLIFGQGALRCHPYLRTEYESLTSSNGLKTFDSVVYKHIGYLAQNKVRSIFHAFTGGYFATGYSSKFNSYYKQITRLSSAFAYVTDVSLLILGGDIKRKERLSARLGDALSNLYMACASLKYFKDNGERKSDELFLVWSLEYSLYNAQEALYDGFDNFSVPFIAKTLKFLMFPYGRPYKKPKDSLEHKIAQNLLHNSETRNAFKAMCYVSNLYDDPVGRIEITYQELIKTLPIRSKIFNAVKANRLAKGKLENLAIEALDLGIINAEEMALLQLVAKHVNEVIQVDEFGKFELGPKNAHPDWENVTA